MPRMDRIFISSSELVIDEHNKTGKKLPDYKINQVVSAKVVKGLSSRKTLLLISGKKVTAKTNTPFKPGEEILLKVIKPGLQPVFKLVDNTEQNSIQNVQAMLKPLGRAGPYIDLPALFGNIDALENNTKQGQVRQLFERLENLLFSTALHSEKSNSGILSKLIQNSGLLWENKLQKILVPDRIFLKEKIETLVGSDMKALALELLTHVHEKEGVIGKSLGSFLDNLEGLQIVNKHSFEESGRFLMHLPVLFDNQLKFGQMYIDLNSNDNSEKDKENSLIRVAFLLELTNMGDFLAEFSILKNAVNGSFGVTNDKIRIFVKNNIPELKSKLKTNGFEVHNIECRVISPETLSSTSLLDRLFDSHDGVLNLIV